MPRRSITVTAYHAGRTHFVASCSRTAWTSGRSSTKSYAAEEGGRNRAVQRRAESAAPPKGPAVLRGLLRLDADG